MKVCIVGGGGGASNAANIIRRLDTQAQIHIFTNRDEIGNLPCKIPFVLKGGLPSWEVALLDTCYSPTLDAGYEAVTMALDELIEKLDGG